MGLFSFWNKSEKRSVDTSIAVSTPSEQSALALLFGKSKNTTNATSLSAYFGARELISNSIARLPIEVKRNEKVLENHPINNIWNRTLMSKFNFIKQMICDVIDHGNAYAYIVRAEDGTPLNLIYCEPGSVSHQYNQRKQEHFYRASFCQTGLIEPINMIHLYKNSFNGVEGKGLLEYAKAVISLSDATDKAASKYYSSGCAVQGALTLKGARRGSKEQARTAFMQAHSGTDGSGIVILDDDIEYKPISSNANESQMLEARIFNVNEIARYFNMNPVLLGDLSHSSYNTIEAANIEFVDRTLAPYIALLEDEFNRKLVKPSERNVFVDFDETYLLGTDKKTISEYLGSLVEKGIMSINEARTTLGLPTKEGCDDLIIPFTDIASNKVNSDSSTNTSQEIQNGE